MTGYSTPHDHAIIHPASCICTACIDVAIVEEDSAGMLNTGWMDVRREQTMQQADELAAKLYDDCLLFQADQHEDMIEFLGIRGDTAL